MGFSFKQACAVALAGSAITSPALASESQNWQFAITPYLYGAAIDATAQVGTLESEIDMSASDVLERLDSGFMAMVAARRGPWVVAFDGSYFSMKDEGSTSVTGPFERVTIDGAVEVTSRQNVYQPMVGYQLLDSALKLDVYGGARYTRLHDALEIAIATSIPSFPGGTRSVHKKMDWTDVVVGVHPRMDLNESFGLEGMVDVGTGDDSDLSYQFLAAAVYHFDKQISGNLGYRVLSQEYEEDNFRWDVTYEGVLLGLSMQF